jgi:glycosyltransferase involved in cell wall biosynthesis
LKEAKNILMLGLIDAQKNDASKIHFFELAKSFSKLSHNVTLIVPNNYLEFKLIEGMNVIKMPINYKENFVTIFVLSILQFIFYFFISSGKFDFVYIRWRLLPCFLIKFINIIKMNRTKIITEHNGWIKLEAEIQHSNKVYSIVGNWLQITDAFCADKVIAVTQGIKNKLVKANIKESKIRVVGNGTNINHFYPIKNRNELKSKYLKMKNKIVLGFIGNISKWQGVDSLITVFDKLAESNENLLLLIIGSGIYLEELIKNVGNLKHKDRIIFKDNISYFEMNLWMNIIDLAFAPKSYILNEIGYSPLKIRDYAAAGKPVISTNVNGIKELTKFGWLETYKDDLECENIITELISNPNKLESMSKKARKYAEENFSWDIIAEKIIDFD